jgi:hypothetical protein
MRRVAAATVAVLLLAVPAAAQEGYCVHGCAPQVREEVRPPRHGHATVAGLNALLGGLTAGSLRAARGGSFLEGFVVGAVGGGAVYGGKVLIISEAPPAALAGRLLAAAGASMTRSASEGSAPFDYLVLPIGPARIHVQPGAAQGERVWASVDAVAAVGLAVAVFTLKDLRIDLPASLATGAPTFRTAIVPRATWGGSHLAGTVIVREAPVGHGTSFDAARALAHERVHLIQYDQGFILWSDPVERRLLRGLTGSDRLARHLDLSLHALVMWGVSAAVPYPARPWETEADILSGSWRLTVP